LYLLCDPGSPALEFLKLLWATWGLLTSPHFEDVKGTQMGGLPSRPPHLSPLLDPTSRPIRLQKFRYSNPRNLCGTTAYCVSTGASTQLPQTCITGLTWLAAVAGVAAAWLVWRAVAPGRGPSMQKTPGCGEKQFQPPAQVVFMAQQWPELL
jgi:hypothetical protein